MLCLVALEGYADLIAYSSAITACARGTAWEQALLLLAELRKIRTQLDVITFGAGISACEKAGTWQQAVLLLDILNHEVQTANAVVYNTATSACGRGRQWQRAELLVQQLCRCNLQADVRSQNALVSARAKWRSALFTVREFLQQSLEPDVITRNALLASLRQHWRRGHLFLHQTPKGSRDLMTYNTTSAAFGAAGEVWRLSFEVLSELLRDTLLPDVFSFSASNACEVCGQWQHSQDLLRKLPDCSIEMNIVTFNSTVSSLDKGSEWQSAQSLLTVLQSQLTEPEVATYNTASSACQKSGKWQRAQSLLTELQERRMPADVFTYGSAISATEEGSHWQQVQNLMCELQCCILQVNLVVCNAAISACARAWRARAAISFYQKLQTEQLEADAITYESLLSAHRTLSFQSTLHFLQVVSDDNVLQLRSKDPPRLRDGGQVVFSNF